MRKEARFTVGIREVLFQGDQLKVGLQGWDVAAREGRSLGCLEHPNGQCDQGKRMQISEAGCSGEMGAAHRSLLKGRSPEDFQKGVA